MPKKNKKAKQDYEAESRPAGLTLGSFIEAKLEAAKPGPDSLPSVSVSSKSTGSSNEVAISSVEDNDQQSPVLEDTTPKCQIRRTKKGNLPLSYESRSKGKKVTVIANVTGDASELLSELKHRAGCGGVIKGETIELQGDRRDLVTKLLHKHPCLK